MVVLCTLTLTVGVRFIDRVEKPKDAAWIRAEMLPEEIPTGDREKREFQPEGEPEPPARLGPGGSHLIQRPHITEEISHVAKRVR